MSKDFLNITDSRTGKSYELEINDGNIRARDLRQIKVNEDEFGMMSYDPSFENTASCKSSVTYIDGDRLDSYRTKKEAEKAASEFIKQYKG